MAGLLSDLWHFAVVEFGCFISRILLVGCTENCIRIRHKTASQTVGKDVQEDWKGYFNDLYNVGMGDRVILSMCGFEFARKSNYFVRERV